MEQQRSECASTPLISAAVNLPLNYFQCSQTTTEREERVGFFFLSSTLQTQSLSLCVSVCPSLCVSLHPSDCASDLSLFSLLSELSARGRRQGEVLPLSHLAFGRERTRAVDTVNWGGGSVK